MTKKFTLLSLLFFCFSFALAQKETFLTGHVIDSVSNSPINNINIFCFSLKDTIYQTQSNASGTFNIPRNIIDKIDSIKLLSVGYQPYIIIINTIKNINGRQYLGSFKMKTITIQLKEVKINAKKRYRDTTRLNFSENEFKEEVMVNNLFNEYGFSKDKYGTLYYKGRPVSDLVVNGKPFFNNGSNEIFSLLPALVLSGIEITETNIDSLTNTTTLQPRVKVNLKLKDKYNRGKFGYNTLAYGTSKRHLAAGNIYSYKNSEQITVNVNANNVNMGSPPPIDPIVFFYGPGGAVDTKDLSFNYHNLYSSKIQLDFSFKGKQEKKNIQTLSIRQDDILNQKSATKNTSITTSRGISDLNLYLIFRPDSLNEISFAQSGNYYKTNLKDSLDYDIQYQKNHLSSNVYKTGEKVNDFWSTDILYKHFSSNKKGRLVSIIFNSTKVGDRNNEKNEAFNRNDTSSKFYSVLGEQSLTQQKYSFKTDITEPVQNYSGYLNFIGSYSSSAINYSPNVSSDSLITDVSSAKLSNNFFQSGLKYHRTYDKAFLMISVKGLFNSRSAIVNGEHTIKNFFNLNGELQTSYRFKGKKQLKFSLQAVTEYPEPYYLINVNNSFDLVAQKTSNLNLAPQLKNNLNISFYNAITDNKSINVVADISYYLKKFGFNVNAQPNAIQRVSIDNMDNAITASVNNNISIPILHLPINIYTNISYFEQPTVINFEKKNNSSIAFNQSVSTTKEIIKNFLSISPTFGGNYSKSFYNSSAVSVYNLSYTDKIAISLLKFELEIYPQTIYNNGLVKIFSFSLNAGIKRKILNNYGILWLQGYDVFNSYRAANNILGAYYAQTVRNSNINRYFILGLNFKFNNIK